MESRPEQPPEGRLIHDAADRLDLSIREAARRAGISYGRWRQIVMGYQNVSPGSFAPVHAPAKTIAKMARVVNVSPAQLTAAGRDDAAEVLTGLFLASLAPGTITGTGGVPVPPASIAGSDTTEDAAEVTRAVVVAAIGPRLERQVWAEVHRHPEGTPASVIFSDPVEAALFSRDAPELQRIRWIAALRSVNTSPAYQVKRAGLPARRGP